MNVESTLAARCPEFLETRGLAPAAIHARGQGLAYREEGRIGEVKDSSGCGGPMARWQGESRVPGDRAVLLRTQSLFLAPSHPSGERNQ